MWSVAGAVFLLMTYLAVPAFPWLPYAAILAAVAGHVWPLWYGFRGGKGAATLIGGMLVLWPLAVAVLIGVWLLVLSISGYVGLSTILAVWSLPALALLSKSNSLRIQFALLAALFLLYTHRSNVLRLRAGTESRFEKARVWRKLFSREAE